jgi:hypothetical protein
MLMPVDPDKARINRARRAAQRQGFTLHRGRTRDPLATDFGWHVTHGRRKVARFTELGDLEHWLAGEGREP